MGIEVSFHHYKTTWVVKSTCRGAQQPRRYHLHSYSMGEHKKFPFGKQCTILLEHLLDTDNVEGALHLISEKLLTGRYFGIHGFVRELGETGSSGFEAMDWDEIFDSGQYLITLEDEINNVLHS